MENQISRRVKKGDKVFTIKGSRYDDNFGQWGYIEKFTMWKNFRAAVVVKPYVTDPSSKRRVYLVKNLRPYKLLKTVKKEMGR